MSTTPDQTDSAAGPGTPRGAAGPETPPTDPSLDPKPTVSPSSTPDGPQTIPAPGQAGQGSDGVGHTRTQTEQANAEMQAENAGTALDQPSDGSGGE